MTATVIVMLQDLTDLEGGGEKENAAASSAVASVSELWKSTARNCKDSQQGLNVDAAEFVMPASS